MYEASPAPVGAASVGRPQIRAAAQPVRAGTQVLEGPSHLQPGLRLGKQLLTVLPTVGCHVAGMTLFQVSFRRTQLLVSAAVSSCSHVSRSFFLLKFFGKDKH